MLQEEARETEEARESRRRWFSDEYFDLVVWLSDSGSIASFELGDEKSRGERAVTWSDDSGYRHFRVDASGDTPMRNRTPILLPGGPFSKDQVITSFTERSRTLDPAIRAFVLQRLRELRV